MTKKKNLIPTPVCEAAKAPHFPATVVNHYSLERGHTYSVWLGPRKSPRFKSSEAAEEFAASVAKLYRAGDIASVELAFNVLSKMSEGGETID